MLDNEYDVVVIGAGPGGSVAARNLARFGYKTLLLEKRERIGYPVRCGEASTNLADLETYGPIDEGCIETIINGLFIYGPDGVNIEVPKPNMGLMLNRLKFDPWLAHLAANDGVEVVTCARATSVSEVQGDCRIVRVSLGQGDGNGKVTETSTQEIRAKMVVGADGVESQIGRMVGLKSGQLPNLTCNPKSEEFSQINHLLFFDILPKANYQYFAWNTVLLCIETTWVASFFLKEGLI